MVILGFRNPFVSLFYIVALGLLAFHLSHGIKSLFQTLGLTDRKLRPIYEAGAPVLAWILFIGYTSIPVSILFFGLGNGVAP
jgi:succinate dehydrogenase / fumarate reductase cytochrome b subunit